MRSIYVFTTFADWAYQTLARSVLQRTAVPASQKNFWVKPVPSTQLPVGPKQPGSRKIVPPSHRIRSTTDGSSEQKS